MESMQFFSNDEVLQALKKRTDDFKEGYRQNIAILSDELMGKTTLLKCFMNGLSCEKLIPIYTEVIPFEFSLFLKRFVNSLLYNYLKSSQLISSRENIGSLIKRIKETLPQTAGLIEVLMAKLEKEKPETLLKDLFLIKESFALESKKQCIIIFDEFQNLKKLGVKNIFQELGKKIMFEKNTLFIFTSSFKNEARQILSADLSLLFGNFETLELEFLNPAKCQLLAMEILGGITIPKEYLNFLINFTGGHPFYLKTICEEASKECRANLRDFLDKETLTSALERLLFNEWGIFNLRFSSFLSELTSIRNKNDFAYLLEAIAIGKNKIRDISSSLRRQKSEISLRLNRLIELGIISKNGSFYAIRDRLYSFWLKFVHFEKINSLEPDYWQQACHFKARIEDLIKEFVDT